MTFLALTAATELFPMPHVQKEMQVPSASLLNKHDLQFLRQQIIDSLGFGGLIPASKDDESLVLEKFGGKFPTTLEMSVFARSVSCADWRQVLVEADRIKHKHLCTLEAGISEAQTDEMKRQHLTLVVPQSLHPTFSQKQKNDLLTVGDFIKLVAEKQKCL